MSKETMPNWLDQRAFLTPERIALECHGEKITFFELNERARKTAGKFAALSIAQGHFVALLLENGVHTVEIIHALEYVGAVIVPLNTRLTDAELRFQLEDSGATLFIYDETFIEKVEKSAQSLQHVRTISTKKLYEQPETNIPLKTEISLDELHTIMYTSGTTGRPKGVMLTYGNHWWSAIGSALNLGLEANDRWLCCVPMFHMSGLSIVMRSVIYGMAVVVHPSFQPERVNQAIQTERITIVSVVSAMLSRMLDSLHDPYPSSFRCVLLGGGPAPKPLLEACQQKQIPVYQTYGMTETASQIVTLSSDYMLTKLGSAGKPLFPCEVKIEKDGQLAKSGEIGEIVVKGPNVTKGYLHREEATNKVMKNGWLYTGDLGYFDAEGFLYVVERRNDLIISGGENVYPAEVEAVLLSHPAVAEAGVTGISDKTWGRVPIAFVVLKSDETCDEHTLISFCRTKLARYKVPKRIHFVSELPRNAANKLLRRQLIHLLGENET